MNNKLFTLESGLSKASETTKTFFSRVKAFYCVRRGEKVRFYNPQSPQDWLECHIYRVETAGEWARITTANSVINIVALPPLNSGFPDII